MPIFRRPRTSKGRNLQYTRVLKALTNPARLKIIKCLLKEPLNVVTLTKRIRGTQYNTSRHLGILRGVGLVDCRVSGPEHVYFIAGELRRVSRGKPVLDLGWCTLRQELL